MYASSVEVMQRMVFYFSFNDRLLYGLFIVFKLNFNEVLRFSNY